MLEIDNNIKKEIEEANKFDYKFNASHSNAYTDMLLTTVLLKRAYKDAFKNNRNEVLEMKDVKEIIKDKFVGEVIDDVEYNTPNPGDITFKFEDGSYLLLSPENNDSGKPCINANIAYVANITGEITT